MNVVSESVAAPRAAHVTIGKGHVVDLGEMQTSLAEVGGKAWALSRAARAGLVTPRGVVITAAARGLGIEGLAAELEAALATLGDGPFAVRSSAVAEDGAARSFAGQLETELHVPRAEVPAAIARCWASAEALRLIRYGGSSGAVAVIVQPMVRATAAGVAFSADPHTGERGVVLIEAVRGLGDRLVAGEVDPEAWRVETGDATRQRAGEDEVLTAAQVAAIADLARAAEALFGAPQDVEWALDGDSVVLLQSRPITALPAPPVPIAIEVPRGSWERDDHHAVLSPLGWHWFQPYPRAMARAMASIGMPLEGVEPARIGGHLYLRFVTGGGDDEKLPPRWVLWLASRLLPAFRRGDRAARRTLDHEAYMETVERWEAEWRPALRAGIEALFDADPARLSDDALLARIEGALDLSARGLEHHAHLGAAGMAGLGKLVLFVQDRLGWSSERILGLLAGSSSATTELHRAIEALVRRHLPAIEAAGGLPRTWAGVARQLPALGRDLAGWMEDNRLRMLHYDPRHPSLGERPEYVMSIVEGAVHALRGGEPARDDADERAALDEARATLDGGAFAELERLLAQGRRLHALRDENGVETVSRPAGLLRHLVLELGRRLGDALDEPEHAVYLTPDEHRPALRGAIPDLGDRVARRRGEESWALHHRGPRAYGPPQGPMPPADVFPSGLSRVFRIFGWITELERVPEARDDALRGIGVGARVVTGRARVVRRPEELAAVRHGEIVVCRITSPEWSVGLGRVAALVTEEGGALSHPAIIARELAVPAVLGIAGVMSRVETGDRLRVDPIDGVVTAIRRG